MTPIPKTSRREFLTGMALLGASSLVRGSTALAAAPAGQPSPGSSWSSADRKAATDQLLDYFGKTAPQLLRPAEGILVHPSIACTAHQAHWKLENFQEPAPLRSQLFTNR